MNPRQKFLQRALSVGLDCGTITPADVTKHCTPEVIATALPAELKAKLLQACLSAPKMDAELIVDTVGTEALVENVPMHVVWDCIAECAGRALGEVSVKLTGKPSSPSKQVGKGCKDKKGAAKVGAKKKDVPKPPAKVKSGAKSASETKSVAEGTNRTRVPNSEFDVDTDVGEDAGADDWDDDIVEVVEEDVIGASTSVLDEIASGGGSSDWAREEETVTRDVNKR